MVTSASSGNGASKVTEVSEPASSLCESSSPMDGERSPSTVLRRIFSASAREMGALKDKVMGSTGVHGACAFRSEEHTSELQSLMRISYAVFCLKKKKKNHENRSKCYILIHTPYI